METLATREQKTLQVKAYPVDLLSGMDYESLGRSGEHFLAALQSGDASATQRFILPDGGGEVNISESNVSFLSLFGEEHPRHRVLALSEQDRAVLALYLCSGWWAVEEALRTSDPSRHGLVEVLAGAVCGREARPVHPEPDCLRDPGEPPRPGQPPLHPPPPQGAGHDSVARRGSGWLLHRQEESGTAGSLCGGCTSLCYQLPVLDTVFVRRSWRRRGLCLEMLEGYCSSFNGEEVLGISYPVSTAMYQVCRKYLLAHPEQRDRLYEAEPPGHWSQRQSIWLQIQLGKIPSADEQQAAAERILLEESRADSSAQEGLRKESPDFVPAAAACPSKLKRKGGATLEEVTPKVKK
ncbi:protein FAM169B-like isoform X1 [Acipenser ruthenus]|uniref:protein FAM169B-like isoform X1 n=1 Tax=Acipenser ruthenus TaxID=7906 RepID=UPI0027417FA3|nr:protein FAM169B-like isoform X1 [Acipenser ruthenus]XP_058855199.1 protein FAM169B-like isoform X1 [Acipenser ruthenus]